ncbi:hypothetical protein GR925_38415 [Streptomyces sp. HUCO-GS316]|uniref:hypothetical protein n=1 Tax=Streptomyces sp. HUCO-GS316 TaxID=2692198 RepID=UPI00136DC236|nr:hypothetical protein [Streptomyces sp. HUCO-GS316]MXM69111.1 hypothetical protein [Streptomyces sp. HUCO-GS316]
MIGKLPRRALVATAAATAVLGGLAAMPPASAGEPAPNHCVLDLDTGAQTCYDGFTAAFSAASDGRITEAPDSLEGGGGAGLQELRAETLQLMEDVEGGANGNVIIGTFFANKDYGGATLTIEADRPCRNNDAQDHSEPTMPPGWNDIITSLQPWANCWIELYSDENFGGDRDGLFKTNTADIGSYMNDRTSSIAFR